MTCSKCYNPLKLLPYVSGDKAHCLDIYHAAEWEVDRWLCSDRAYTFRHAFCGAWQMESILNRPGDLSMVSFQFYLSHVGFTKIYLPLKEIDCLIYGLDLQRLRETRPQSISMPNKLTHDMPGYNATLATYTASCGGKVLIRLLTCGIFPFAPRRLSSTSVKVHRGIPFLTTLELMRMILTLYNVNAYNRRVQYEFDLFWIMTGGCLTREEKAQVDRIGGQELLDAIKYNENIGEAYQKMVLSVAPRIQSRIQPPPQPLLYQESSRHSGARHDYRERQVSATAVPPRQEQDRPKGSSDVSTTLNNAFRRLNLSGTSHSPPPSVGSYRRRR